MDYSKSSERFISKIVDLNDTVWEGRIQEPQIEDWLKNFRDEKERIHVLYLLSMFMYFGSDQMRAVLKSLFRDLFKYPIIKRLRENNEETMKVDFLNKLFFEELKKTRFLGLGNPSESGPFLLYSFRQENELPKYLFIHEHEILSRNVTTNKEELRYRDVSRYVFIDDFCGTGSQALRYSRNGNIKAIKELNPDIQIYYFSLFSTKMAKEKIIESGEFDKVETVVEFDSVYRCFDKDSRYRENVEDFIDMDYLETVCRLYGKELMRIICELEGATGGEIEKCAENNALGFRDSQLLIGFNHNTPDNTLPIFWFSDKKSGWFPIFKRYNKIYK